MYIVLFRILGRLSLKIQLVTLCSFHPKKREGCNVVSQSCWITWLERESLGIKKKSKGFYYKQGVVVHFTLALFETDTLDITSGDEDIKIHESHSQYSHQHWFSLRSSLCKFFLKARAVCDALNSVRPHGGFATKFSTVRRPCRWQCRSTMEKMARTLRTNAYRNEHHSCEKETGFVAALCRHRRRRNIRHLTKHWRRRRLWHGGRET